MTVKRLVLDASAALKWVLRDEEATLQADALLADFLAGRLSLSIPSLFDYEIANALAMAVAKGRLAETKVKGQRLLIAPIVPAGREYMAPLDVAIAGAWVGKLRPLDMSAIDWNTTTCNQ